MALTDLDTLTLVKLSGLTGKEVFGSKPYNKLPLYVLPIFEYLPLPLKTLVPC